MIYNVYESYSNETHSGIVTLINSPATALQYLLEEDKHGQYTNGFHLNIPCKYMGWSVFYNLLAFQKRNF
jgi:hypothetical protein